MRFWGCPICDYRINEPFVDVWIYNMLIDNQRGSEVLVREDGSYEWSSNVEDNVLDLESDESSEPRRKGESSKMDVEPVVEKEEEDLPEKVEIVIDIENEDEVL
jgi:hypothetical protein